MELAGIDIGGLSVVHDAERAESSELRAAQWSRGSQRSTRSYLHFLRFGSQITTAIISIINPILWLDRLCRRRDLIY